MPTQPTYCWLHSTYSVGARYETVQALLSVHPLLSVQPLLSVHPTLSVQPQLDLKLVPRLHFANVGSDKLGYSGGQKQSEQSNFLFSCPVCTAVQWAVKLALCAGLRPLRRATCLGSRGVEGSTTRCRHLRPVRSHWQTICHGVTASITDQKHQWKCKGHSMKAMGIPLWTCNDVLTFFVITTW